MTRAARLLVPLLLVAAAGCGPGDDAPAAGRAPAVDPAPAVEPVARSFWARPESEDYRETVPRNEVGAHFLMHVAPRIETPAEGPWTIAFVGPSGRELARFEGMRVDVATGHFTFLCATDRFAPGDWTVVLRVEEGGLSGGARRRTFRFHVE